MSSLSHFCMHWVQIVALISGIYMPASMRLVKMTLIVVCHIYIEHISPKRTWFSSITRWFGGCQLFREKLNPYRSKHSLSPNFSVAHCIPLRKATNYEATYSLTIKTGHGKFSVYNTTNWSSSSRTNCFPESSISYVLHGHCTGHNNGCNCYNRQAGNSVLTLTSSFK